VVAPTPLVLDQPDITLDMLGQILGGNPAAKTPALAVPCQYELQTKHAHGDERRDVSASEIRFGRSPCLDVRVH